ncbi:MAG: radical SAM protein [bacterium]|nr:radical SAM protein [bacterium]
MNDCILAYPIPTADSPVKGSALSIFYPGAMLEQNGLKVEYFDERFDKFDDLLFLLKENPVCVGVSSMTGYQLIRSKRILETVKKVNPNIYTIFGGAHPSLLPAQCIKEDFVDFVVVGEGEKTLLELVMALKNGGNLSKVDGIFWKNKGKIIANKHREFMDPTEWPFPLTPKNRKYFKIAANRGELMFPASRGCPYNCNFCYNQTFNRRSWRPMPLDKFEKELGIFLREFKIKNAYINDDNIGSNKARIKKIAEIIKRFGITWSTSIRCSDMDEETARVFEESGCHELLLGVESGSDRVLNEVVNKMYPKGSEDIRNCARILSKTKIRGRYNFIAGLPSETAEETHKSMDLADWIWRTDQNAKIAFAAFSPYPGSKLYQEALKAGFKEPQDFSGWSKMSLSNEVNPIASNLYYIAGLKFREKKGDSTNRNFSGLKRLIIYPFEISARLRWKYRFLKYYELEKFIIKMLFIWASKRT